MDFLARSLGLDINAIAIQLAIEGDSSIPPTQKVELGKID
jgi:hypothetical protein